MEVLVGPTFEIDAAAYVRTQNESAAHVRDVVQDEAVAAGGDLFLKDGKIKCGEDLSESSSSIGVPADSSEEEEEDDTVSSNSVLGSLSSLQDCLPIKRGLSNHYTGRSKSFANLSEASGVKDLEKVENPFNKRRRILMANKWSRTSSSSTFYSWRNPKSMPLLSLQEEDEGGNVPPDGNDEDDDEFRASSTSFTSSSPSSSPWSSPMLPQFKLQSRKMVKADLKSQSCFSLRDLEEENQ